MNLFEINNLTCSYNSGPTVLNVKHLTIESGKLIVILGLSGAGKSTFLETLGLMNNTLSPGSQVRFCPEGPDKPVYDYEKLWAEGNDLRLSEIRRKHFSFIFQSTNLMPNFTTFENISLTQMLQGKSWEEAQAVSRKYLDLIGLEEIDERNSTFEISGGQRQRVAFIRAITPEFTILFGDEPTGNLDEKNSWDLMALLKKQIKGMHKTALIVSHNIDLALDFADQLIIINKVDDHGMITRKGLFVRDEIDGRWKDQMGRYSDKSELKESLQKDLGRYT